MAHDPDCNTCLRLEGSDASVALHETDDPCIRRFTATPWPIDAAQAFDSSDAARTHPLARALWRNGTTRIVLDPDGATVTRADPRAWAFYGEGMAVSLREQLALL